MSAELAPVAPPAVEGGLARLLDVDPELARHFDAAELPQVAAELTVAVRMLRSGDWVPSPHRPAGLLGLLIVDGAILRTSPIADRSCTHLIGPGDIIDPWTQMELALSGPSRYQVVEPVELAVLNSRFSRHAARWPQLLPAVMERLLRQNEQVSGLYALALLPRVDTRLIGFFWHLAQRWGRVTRDGVIIPLALTHRTLGELVGGRRPTISVALTELDQAGLLSRRPDGCWALARDSWKLLADTPCPIDPTPILGGGAA